MRLVKPKKALGQHFLKDLQIAQRIADTLDTFKSLPVLEIGPGMGVLTQFLLEAGHDLTVVELDMESVDYLNQNFPRSERTYHRRGFPEIGSLEAISGAVLCDR